MRRLLVVAIVALSVPARADAPAVDWQGFAAIGVPSEQMLVLEAATTRGLSQGGLVGDPIDDRLAGASCESIACHCALARTKGLRYAAFGTLGNLGSLWNVELTIIDTHACTVEATSYFNEIMSLDDAVNRVRGLARQITTPRAAVAQTATKRDEPVALTPAIVATITKRQMRELQLRSLDQVLPLLPGIEVMDANWGGVVLNQNMENTLLLMVDGIPLVNGITNFRTLGRDFQMSLHHLERIEMVRGPGGVVWGKDAFLGVLNFISEAPSRREAAVEAALTATSFDTQEAYVHGVQNRGDYGFNVAIETGRRRGPTTYVPDSPFAVLGVPDTEPIPYGNAGTVKPLADTWLDMFLRLQVSKYVTLFAQGHSSTTHFEISPFGPRLGAGTAGAWEKDDRVYAAVVTIPDGNLTWRAQASRYELLSWENYVIQPGMPGADPGAPDAVRSGLRALQGSRDPRAANQAELSLSHTYHCPVENTVENYAVAGLGLLHQSTADNVATLVGAREEPAMETPDIPDKNLVTISQYGLDELRLRPWLVLSAGARIYVDKPYVADESWKLHGSTQAGIAVGKEGWGAKLLYSEGYRPPNAGLLYSAVGTKGNPALDPERSHSGTLELHGDVSPNLSLTVNGSLTRLRDLIVFVPLAGDPNFVDTPTNRGVIDIASAFVHMKATFGAHVDGWLTYHVSGLRESDPLGTGISTSTHSGSFAAIWRPFVDVSAFVRGSFASPRKVRLATAAGDVEQTTRTSVRSTVGLTLSRIVGGFDLDLAIDNFLNRSREVPYRLDGTTAGLIEIRQGVEFMATARISQ